jgi:hypothetical protein
MTRTNYIKVEDLKHPEYPFGIEAIELDEDNEYLETIDVWWFTSQQERDHQFKDLILE